jgi:hypothetical protein
LGLPIHGGTLHRMVFLTSVGVIVLEEVQRDEFV